MTGDVAELIDFAWSDPGLETAVWAMIRGEVQPGLDLLAACRPEVDRREIVIQVLGAASQRQLTALRELVDRDPGDADRWLLYSGALANAAFTARGAATADHTSEAQFLGMADLLEQARDALARASGLAPHDHVPYCLLLQCAIAMADHEGEHQEIFAKILERHPWSYFGHTLMLTALTRKWYGSQRQVREFARERTATVPDGHPLLALTAHAHIEGYLDGAMRGGRLGKVWRLLRYFKDRTVLAELQTGSARLLASPTFAGHPQFIAANQAYAMVFHHAEDAIRSAPHLLRSGNRPARWPWLYFGDPHAEFAAARRAAGLPPAATTMPG
jgi:hypothetical protein